MLNLSRSAYDSDIPYSEISDRSIGRCKKYRLPRHMTVLESPSHSNKTCSNLFQAVKKCPLQQQSNSEKVINAVNILQYQLQDRASQQKHLENLRSNLMRRLKVAKSTKNSQLVTMLQEEFKQLEVSS